MNILLCLERDNIYIVLILENDIYDTMGKEVKISVVLRAQVVHDFTF